MVEIFYPRRNEMKLTTLNSGSRKDKDGG
jgi:hypothetical protein